MKLSRLLLLPVVSTAAAAPVPHDVCVPQGFGVPTRGGPPDWWSGSADTALDDPRWNQSTTQSFAKGGATASLHTRTLWAKVGAQEFAYLSFISDLAANDTTPRDLFVGFHRATMNNNEYGYVLHVHVAGGTTAAQAQAINYCASYTSCSETTSWWRMFYEASPGDVAGCDTITSAKKFATMPSSGTNTPPASVAWFNNTLRMWRNPTNSGANPRRWAVQLQVPLVAAGQPIANGIEKGATYWYEATEASSSTYFSIAKWPIPSADRTGVTHSVCVNKGLDNYLVHQDLENLASWSKLTAGAQATAPTDCDTSLQIGFVGVIDGTTKTNKIRSDQANHMSVEVVNPPPTAGGTSVTMPTGTIHARFRLANWGTQVWDVGSTDHGVWNDVPGGNDVCLSGCTATNVTLAAPSTSLIQFDWNLTDTETCQYQVPRTGVSCSSTSCADPDTQVSVNGAPCITKHNQHQCMYVELTAPNSEVGFTQASAYNNMDFATMSQVAREALIDARHLPKEQDQKFQDIYFIVQPRNMPATLPPNTTVNGLVKDGAQNRALEIARPYIEDMEKKFVNNEDALKQVIEAVDRQRPPMQKRALPEVHRSDVQQKILKALRIMPNDDFDRVYGLMTVALSQEQSNEALVKNAVATLGPADAAQIVPTLEVYPFYQPMAKGKRYEPMTSFTVFLSHEGGLSGMRYEIDGAREVEQNLYHVRIPVDFARRIQVRAAALPETVANGNPNWPCPGGCACGNKSCGLVGGTTAMLPGAFAFAFVMRRRKRRATLLAPLL